MTKDQLAEYVSSLKASNERLLQESKHNKTRFQETSQKLDEIERSKQEEQGRFKELYESTKTKLDEWQNKVKRSSIETSVKMAAEKAGCIDPDVVLAVGSQLGLADLLQYDDDAQKAYGTEEFIEAVKKQKPKWFQQATNPKINSALPGGKSLEAGKLTAKDLLKNDAARVELLKKAMMRR